MLAAENGNKDVVFILVHRGANLNLVNAVSVLIDRYVTFNNPCITEDKMQLFFLKRNKTFE